MSTAVDLEAQQVSLVPPHAASVLGGAEAHEMGDLGPHASGVPSPLRSVSESTGQEIDDEAQSVVSQAEGSGSNGVPEMNMDQSHIVIRDDVSGISHRDRSIQGELYTSKASSPSPDAGAGNITSDSESEEPHMIGDFDGSANEFWKLYRGEAKSHDGARISTLKDGMDSALIFAGLFSAILTAFVVDSKQNLKPSPADETVYYLRQHSAILTQISVQLSSIAPQVPIPSTPPAPFPSFSPLASDIRINVFWFMALAFSLLAALLAILVQQWVRNYMHVFQRYGDPLKSSRLRQYLYEGCEKWHMPGVAEVVPGFLHVSLFLFFAGLTDSLLNINKNVALSIIVPIGIFGLLYTFTIVAPIIYPQSPYQNLFSGILWYLIQKLRGRKFKDHRDGETKFVSGNMALGQMQLAMEETVGRKDRDVGATRWLIDNLTEDAEMETFLSAIPGSFNTEWGREVWKRVGEHQEREDQSHVGSILTPHKDTTADQPSSPWSIRGVIRPITQLVTKPTPRHPPLHSTTSDVHPQSATTHIQEDHVVYELSTRIARSVELCGNRGLFASDDLWRRRTRACVEATASLVFCADAKLAWFGGISKLLGDIGGVEKIRKLSSEGMDELFVVRWTCLSLVATRPNPVDNDGFPRTATRHFAREAINHFASLDDSFIHRPLLAARKIDETLKKANKCLTKLNWGLFNKDREGLTEEVKEIVRGLESEIAELEQLNIEADLLRSADYHVSDIGHAFNNDSHQMFSQIPGILDELDFDCRAPIPFGRFVELTDDPRALQFIYPGQTLKSMCSPALTLRNILQGQGDADAYEELQKSMGDFHPSTAWQGYEMERQVWRLQDLDEGGGFGFTVELFFIALLRLLSTPSSKESHSALYTGTFRVITSDWSEHKDSLGTQKLLLDIATSRFTEFCSLYPAYIVDEFLSLLGNILEGRTGPHIDYARQKIEGLGFFFMDYTGYRKGLLRVLSQGQTQPVAS